MANRSTVRYAVIAAACIAIPLAVTSQEPLKVDGVAELSPVPGATDVPADGEFRIRLTAASSFGFVEGNRFRVFNAETGEQMGEDVQFKPGDPQEGKTEIVLPFSQFSLLAGSTYYATADGTWARVNDAPWNVGPIPPKAWTFTTAGERPRLTRPDAFTFEERRDMPPGQMVQSGAVRLDGINVAVPVTVTGGEYSIDNGPFTAAAGTAARNQMLRVRGRAPAEPGAVHQVRVQAGETEAVFRISTAQPDGLADGFLFLDEFNATPGAEYESETITVSGLRAPAGISVTGGEYSLDGHPFTAEPGTAANGQTLKLRTHAPEQYNHASSAVLRIGGAEAAFVVRTPVFDPAECREKSIGPDPASITGRRLPFNFPTVDGAKGGETVTSACVKLTGVGNTPVTVSADRAELSINGRPFSTNPGVVRNGDELRARITASIEAGQKVEESIRFTGVTEATFSVRTRNDDREPRVFQVGPERRYREISEITGQLRAGDVVEVDGGANYAPVIFRRPGAPGKPIIIRGIAVNGRRPVIQGGTRTVQFEESNHIRFENFEVTGGTQMCVRMMGNDILLRNVWVHGCQRHGILGADFYNGSNTLDRVEVSDAGGQPRGENTQHILYIATDRDRYPGSRLRVQHSYLHDIRGDAIKSRSERNEIYYNWIDTGTHPEALYSLELIGFEEYLPEPRIDSDVVGNVLNHRQNYGIRLGGDGTGESRGRVRLVNNTFVQSPRLDGFTPVVRLFQGIDAVLFVNNVFVRAVEGGQQPLRLLRVDEISWASGAAKIAGRHNWLPNDTTLEAVNAKDWTGTIQGTANPGLASISSPDNLDLAVESGRPLAGAGAAPDTAVEGYEVEHSLSDLRYRAPRVQPASGEAMKVRFRDRTAAVNIGAW